MYCTAICRQSVDEQNAFLTVHRNPNIDRFTPYGIVPFWKDSKPAKLPLDAGT